jgi:hypothetical protein
MAISNLLSDIPAFLFKKKYIPTIVKHLTLDLDICQGPEKIALRKTGNIRFALTHKPQTH